MLTIHPTLGQYSSIFQGSTIRTMVEAPFLKHDSMAFTAIRVCARCSSSVLSGDDAAGTCIRKIEESGRSLTMALKAIPTSIFSIESLLIIHKHANKCLPTCFLDSFDIRISLSRNHRAPNTRLTTGQLDRSQSDHRMSQGSSFRNTITCSINSSSTPERQ